MRSKIEALAIAAFALVNVAQINGQDIDTAAAVSLYPFDPAIEQHFERGIEAWGSEDYATAFTEFQAVLSAPKNRRTTAATLMAGRALLTTERYGEAVGLLASFIDRYPESRYAEPAKRTLDLARDRYDLERSRESGIFELGVLLPMSSSALSFTRSMFTGIRIAVDEFNRRGGREVRIVFEDTRASARHARAAARRLLRRSNPAAIIGPLFSEEAVAVAEVADSAGVLLLVPLATDGKVASGRTSVFQANPTYEMRGRVMARHAINRLRYNRLGVMAETSTFAARMADGFAAEAESLRAEVQINKRLRGLRDWYSISESFVGETGQQLAGVQALYVPITGENAAGLAAIALDEIALSDARLPLLGNGEWSHYPDVDRMALHELVYAVDFRVDSTRSEVERFDREYRNRMSRSPDQPAFVGYDVTKYMLEQVRNLGRNESLVESFHVGGEYEGLGIRLNFGGTQVNQSLFFAQFTNEGVHED